ncbi:Cell morphogenesis protein PAG1 [Vermiconidia calcicola]|uniref:Cell morphogenesis protein PAG1 n=1 Tax=Vermiconidia calcicola TaxID=1690605 RepID=A0ACC3NG60_9PEZI|nr:Cell morphogenesis protein PAG1 [Vermiconidia calcicola]
MTVPSPSDGRATTSSSLNNASSSASPEPLLVAPPIASREPSSTRGRALSATSPRNAPPRQVTPASQGRAKQSFEIPSLERKASQIYGHHRQTSIVHGVQHSRNPSLLSTTNTSPLSPQKIMAHSAGPDGPTYTSVPSLKKSPSMSVLHSSTPNASSLSVNRSFEANTSQRRPERMHSGRVKRGHEHQRSQSRTQVQQGHELKTVGEYALHHLFTSFIAEADERIERCISKTGQQEPKVESICGPGADPAFDQLISSLGHINRHKPNWLIDIVILWRKKKADIANAKLAELLSVQEALKLTQRNGLDSTVSAPISPPGGQDVVLMEHGVATAERRSGVSIYILCRVLIEILGQTTLKALNGPENVNKATAARLEDVIYGQLHSADVESISSSPLRRANWVIRGQLLGVMSGLRFEEVADRFIVDLEKAQKKLSIKGLSDPKLASKTALLVQSMRWLRVRSYPEDAWEHSCDMLQLLAKFFAEVHGRPMKHAYAELFEQLLLPVAATATSELNMPKWKDVLTIIQPKLSQMLPKADHWPHVFPLQAVLLCVSPTEQFANQWLPLVSSFQPRARDRAGRSHALKAICRLVWRYLYRHTESQNTVAKKLDEVVKLVFQGGKRVLISTDPVIADPLIQLIRIIGYKHQDLCFRTIIFPLMNSEQLLETPPQLKIESLDPEKTVIAIRAFLAIMTDLENGEPPPFPTSFECDALMDPASRSPVTHRRTKSQGFAVSAGRTERLSRPVTTENFNDVAKEYYTKFCRILGNLTIICDNTFGGQAVLDEKLSTHTPKTPMAEAFTFNKRDDLMNPTDVRQHYYDLLHVAVEALPRCLSREIQINPLVNLLCTGTAHVESHIASSSTQSLKSIARQSYAQQVTIGFARFIFNFDDRYATVSDGSLLGPGHIESTLKLYVELLRIWIEDTERRTRKAVADPTDEDHSKPHLPLDLSSVLAHVDEVESHGLFFLCSPSRTVRAIAVTVLRLVTKFETALGQPSTRIISLLEGSSNEIININDDRLSLAERSRLQKGLRKSNLNSTLVELCSSDVAHDANLWFKVFPNLIRLSSQVCLHAVALTRELVCQRLSHSYRTISALADGHKQVSSATFDQAFLSSRPVGRFNSSSLEIIAEQWKIHLIFACTTLTNIGSSSSQTAKSSQSSQHTRKSSKSSSASQEKIASATELFSRVVRFLSVSNPQVRNAAVTGLGATNATLFHTLLECLHPYVAECNNEVKGRISAHQRNIPPPPRTRKTDYLRTELTHLLSLICRLLHDQANLEDDFALTYLIDYAKYTRLFLSDADIQTELDFQKLRTHFCALTEGLYDFTRKLKEPSRWMSFQSRQATFSLVENWCGFSPNESQLRRREDQIRRSILEREQDLRNRGIINSAFEKQKSELQNAALSAMAMLCAGPLTFNADNRTLMQFDVRRMLAWVHSIFETPSDRMHAVGRKALQNLIVHNPGEPSLMAQSMRMCYTAKNRKALASYFDVVTKVLTENTHVKTPFWKILCAGLYTLGNEDSQIRMKSARLLRTLEERQGKSSKLQDLDIRVSDKTTAVYKLAQFEISRRLATQHAELAFHVFSEFSAYFKELEPDHQRNMVSAMLPWIQKIPLQLDPNGGPTANSYMLLVNLFEITAKSSIALHNEIQALWQALATGGYDENVKLVLDFTIYLCLDKKEQGFVHYAKQIVVFLAQTPAGLHVVDHLMAQIDPKTMVTDRLDYIHSQPDAMDLPYVANVAEVVPGGAKLNHLALGHLCMILLVDLIVSPFALPADKVVHLLQVILVQWDGHGSIVLDQAREMLVHLIHELVVSKIEPGKSANELSCIEDFVESVRRQDPKVAWTYSDGELRLADATDHSVAEPVAYVVKQVVKIFSAAYPCIGEEWSRVSMQWATSCPVRHVACRSFQVFRCMQISPDQQMLADMLARLSNTIADDEHRDYLMFSLEILTTLRSIIEALAPEDLLQYPQLFWTTCACLDTIFEREFQEGLRMLNLLLSKLDVSDPTVLQLLTETQPPTWEGGFQGLHALIYKGVRSSQSMDQSLGIMERLIRLPSSDIVGGDERLLFSFLANLPRYLHHFEDSLADFSVLPSAGILAAAAESQKLTGLSRALDGFAKSRIRNQKDFLSQCMNAVRAVHFPTFEFDSLVFLLGMVNNQCSWFKMKTMQILCVMIPEIDMRKPEFASQGPDLISPLLRLLQTEHYQLALDVLDNVIHMAGTPNDSKHLRMSMAGSHSSRATRKAYESTKSLYGIPEESGWSIPMPAIHSAQTRGNVHAVFTTAQATGMNGVESTVSTPDVEFDRDEWHDSYFTDRTATMMSDDTKVDGNMGELAMKLDSLDDFFDEPVDTNSPSNSFDLPRYPSGLIEEREALYDQQALPILHKSLKRNTSVTSFQTGLAELRYQPTREPAVMNPTAFSQDANGNLDVPVRPGLHNRSITSPAMSLQQTQTHMYSDMTSGDESGFDRESSFSDDDLAIGRAYTAGEPHSAQNTVRPAGFKAGLRQGLRRLTSSSGGREAREALKAATGAPMPLKSPKVPKVPVTFLRDPMSAEL